MKSFNITKNIMKYVVALVVTLLILISNFFISNDAPFFTLETMYGIKGIGWITYKVYFLLNIILIQYVFSDTILFFKECHALLIIRYESKKRINRHIRNNMVINNLLVTGLALLGLVISCLCLGIGNLGIKEIIMWCLCAICFNQVVITLQATLLLRLEQDKTFMIISGCAIIYSFIVPKISSKISTVLCAQEMLLAFLKVVAFIAVALIFTMLFRKEYYKEWQDYAN